MACGTHDLVLSDGTKLTVPQVARQGLRDHLWSGFVNKHTDAAGNFTGGISRSDFFDVSESATKGQQKTFAALDQIKVRCGRENFAKGREIVKALVALNPTVFVGYEDFLLKLIQRFEDHCKTGLPKHLKSISTVANHCVHHMFGGQQVHSCQPCGNACDGHKDHCKDCDRGQVFLHVIRFVS